MKIAELNDLQKEYIDIILHVKLEERTSEQNERVKFLCNELRKRGQLTKTIRLLRELRR